MKRSPLAVIAFALSFAGSASATIVVLDFEHINGAYPPTSGTTYGAFINGFYNGGTSSDGTTGTNYGVDFSSNAHALCLNSASVWCSNTSRGGLGDPNSQEGGLTFTSNGYMNVAAGFQTGFSFFYSAVQAAETSSVSVYDGLDGTGNLLATLVLPTTGQSCAADYKAQFCPFYASGIGFSGTAKSVAFTGSTTYAIFDEVTLGSTRPGGTAPEPGTLALLGLGLAGLAATRRRKQ